MAVSPQRARDLALGLAGASEAPHFHRLAFRTKRKIFATLDATIPDLNLMFNAELRDFTANNPPLHSPPFLAVGAGWAPRGAI